MKRKPGSWARGLGAGLLSGVAATLVLFTYRFATGVPTPVEALAERMLRLLPYQVFALILAKLQHLAKPLGLGMAVIVSLIGFGLGGMLYARVTQGSRWPRLGLGLVAAGVTWIFLTYAFLPFIQGRILGIPLTTVVSDPALPLGIGSLVYGLLLAILIRRPDPARVHPSMAPAPRATPIGDAATASGSAAPGAVRPGTVGRRDLLRRSALMLLGMAAISRLAEWGSTAARGVAEAANAAFRLIKGMPPEVTPNGQFYQVSKNFFDPTVDVAKWSLEVTGLVEKTLKLSLKELTAAAPAVERYHTFECISNEVGGDLISTARWKGVRVRDILALAGVKQGATTVIWRAADGYTESIALSIASDSSTLLAYEMNGEPIPQKHGAPVRVLILNRYGMKQPKWLTHIEVANHDITGYWEQQGWSKEAVVKPNSAFRVQTAEGGGLALGGWAFAGSRGIAKVEISADGGKTWFPAAVKEPLGENCWQFWSADWRPPAPGDYTLAVRATDGKGALQPRGPKPTLPDGGEGYHTVRVHFAG